MITDEQGTKVFAAAFGRRVAADHKLLGLVSLTLTEAPLRRPDSVYESGLLAIKPSSPNCRAA
jgi:hypothetical protein